MIRPLSIVCALLGCLALPAVDDYALLPPLAPTTTEREAGLDPATKADAKVERMHRQEGGGRPEPTAKTQPAPTAVVQPEADIESSWHQREVLPARLGATLTQGRPLTRAIASGYALRASDMVRVVVWGGQSVNERLPISMNGDLPVPGFGMVPVAGLSQSEAQVRVLELVRSQFKQGGAVIALEEPGPQAVTVVGEVVRPGYLTLPAGGTVVEALTAAGGVLPQGSMRRIRVVNGEATEEIDLYQIVVDGNATALKPLPPGSVVFVPLAGPQVAVFGAVRHSSLVELRDKEFLSEALRLAGGPAAGADPDTIRMIHESDRGQQIEQMPFESLSKRIAADGDRLLIVRRRVLSTTDGAVEVRGAVRSPGFYAWSEGLTVGHVLSRAGGALPTADGRSVVVRRLLSEPKLIDLGGGVPGTLSYETLPGFTTDLVLRPRDVVEIPSVAKAEDSLLTVSINGAVQKPGVFPLSPDMSMRDLLILAGRPLPGAQVDQADLVRSTLLTDGRRDVRRESIDLRPILVRNEPGPLLRPGDTVVIRKVLDTRVAVELKGQFRNSGTFTIPSGTTLSQLVALSGGLTPEAFPRGLRVFRAQEKAVAQEFLRDLTQRMEISLATNRKAAADAPGDEERQEVERTVLRQQAALTQVKTAVATGRMAGVDLARIMAGDLGADVLLADGDLIDLPSRPGTIRVLGEVLVPGSLLYTDGLSVREIIQRSGGATRHADQESIFVVRADGSVVATAQGDTLAWDTDRRKWIRTSLRGLTLTEGDSVIVPADVSYRDTNRRIVRDWSQIIFQVAATVGTIALLAK